MPPTKMVPPELLNTLDSEQLRALVDAYENVLDVARSRLAAAEQSDARARHYAAAAARARTAWVDRRPRVFVIRHANRYPWRSSTEGGRHACWMV